MTYQEDSATAARAAWAASPRVRVMLLAPHELPFAGSRGVFTGVVDGPAGMFDLAGIPPYKQPGARRLTRADLETLGCGAEAETLSEPTHEASAVYAADGRSLTLRVH
jgi:hypothetical protein